MPAAQSSTGRSHYTLYHNPYSIASLMVRYTLALRNEPKDAESAMEVDLVEVDLYKSGQLEEHFLCDINPAGQVQ